MKNEYAVLLDQLTSIRKIRRKILNEVNANLADMNSRDFLVFYQICKVVKEPTMSYLSESTGLSNALITSSVDSLEGLNLVKRRRGPDRRSYVVRLTNKGVERCQEMEKVKNRSINKIFSSMTKDDLDELKGTLMRLNDLIEKYA